jgi:hypothetical protein
LSVNDLFTEKKVVHHRLLENENEYKGELETLGRSILGSFGEMKEILSRQDPGLGKYASAEERKLEKTLDSFYQKSFRQVKKANEGKVGQYDRVLEIVFPGGGLQERYDNSMPLLAKHGMGYLDFLVENLNPLDKRFLVLEEEAS